MTAQPGTSKGIDFQAAAVYFWQEHATRRYYDQPRPRKGETRQVCACPWCEAMRLHLGMTKEDRHGS